MKPRVYIETTVLGYLTSWPSGDLVVAGRQKITRDWWRSALNTFDLVVSELVHREASVGDPQAIRDWLEALKTFRSWPSISGPRISPGLWSRRGRTIDRTGGCASHCPRGGQWHRILGDLELQTHRECRDEVED